MFRIVTDNYEELIMSVLNTNELRKFDKSFNTVEEDNALNLRGEFLKAYPLNNLKNITLDEYVIGKRTPSFCTYVEVKTKKWANIQGATSSKFGIYFGKEKNDSSMQYRYARKFGEDEVEAFDNVKDALLALIEAAKSKDFQTIDENPLSQMFKAKILSLYFPEIYLNICSAEHIKRIASELGIETRNKHISQLQHLLLEEKLNNTETKNWSNPKFMRFLYFKFPNENKTPNTLPQNTVKTQAKQIRKKVNFDEITKNRNAIGKKSEEYAIEWEKNRLIGCNYEELIKKIEDRRDYPSYGYDYLSFSSPRCERHIEVKSVGRDRDENCFRFFLSENEKSVSETDENYYFYLVFYNKNGEPYKVLAQRAKDLYSRNEIEIEPCAYIVRFDSEDNID